MSYRRRRRDYRESGMLPPAGGRAGNLYYVRLRTPIGLVYKLGFTSMQSVHERLAFKGDGVEGLIDRVLFFRHYPVAWDLEQELHVLFFHKKLFAGGTAAGMPLLGNGQSELYGEDILGMDPDYSPAQAAAVQQAIRGGSSREVDKDLDEFFHWVVTTTTSVSGAVDRFIAWVSALFGGERSRSRSPEELEEERRQLLVAFLRMDAKSNAP